ncbi:MAG: hypothetical protein JST28_06270 [Acidobacteria bacterium]|nr:hypothetical protein [Acidobacteriota bacterium]
MRLSPALFAGAALCCAITGFAQSTTVSCDQKLSAPLRARSLLEIASRPAGLEIVGTDEETIRVTCDTHNSDETNAERIRLRFSPNATGGKLKIEGEHLRHGNGAQIRIEVPKKTSLMVRMFAGEVKTEQVSGDKDISVGAGQITISNHNWDYRSVDASVSIGQVNAPMYSANKGGFFRGVNKSTQDGEYRLHAHVTTGQIDLEGKRTEPGATPKPD